VFGKGTQHLLKQLFAFTGTLLMLASNPKPFNPESFKHFFTFMEKEIAT